MRLRGLSEAVSSGPGRTEHWQCRPQAAGRGQWDLHWGTERMPRQPLRHARVAACNSPEMLAKMLYLELSQPWKCCARMRSPDSVIDAGE